jgi:3-hydroxybutyrate dehydrogenase
MDHDQAVARFLSGKQPSGRFVEAGHVAELAVFLCGPAGRDITGAMLPMDGGWLAG